MGVHLGKVLIRLILQDADGVIHRNDAHQALLVIHHGDGQQAVFFKHLGGFFPVGGGMHADDAGLHQFPHGTVLVLFQHQRPQGNNTLQGAVGARDIAVVDGFLVDAVLADLLHGAAYRPVGRKFHELGGHHAAGGIFGVLQQFIDHLPCFRPGLGQDALDHTGGHLLHQVGGVIGAELFHNELQFPVGQAFDQALLGLGGQFGKNLRRQVLGAQAVENGEFFRRQILKNGGHIGGRQGLQHITQALVLLGVIQVSQHGLDGLDRGIRHKKAASFRRQPAVSGAFQPTQSVAKPGGAKVRLQNRTLAPPTLPKTAAADKYSHRFTGLLGRSIRQPPSFRVKIRDNVPHISNLPCPPKQVKSGTAKKHDTASKIGRPKAARQGSSFLL